MPPSGPPGDIEFELEVEDTLPFMFLSFIPEDLPVLSSPSPNSPSPSPSFFLSSSSSPTGEEENDPPITQEYDHSVPTLFNKGAGGSIWALLVFTLALAMVLVAVA